jgi:large subunit ribosomal protein L24|tara:strand:- start:2975 stop:3310 length:336 start_codon:yes stop_codon:yes gene_type:complete
MPKHVRKGDQVIVTSGDYKGQTGEVLDVITKTDRVLVKGINVRTKHVKPTQLNPQGGIVTKEMSIHISNVSPVAEGRATRVRFETKADGSKARVAVRGGKSLGQIRGPKQK